MLDEESESEAEMQTTQQPQQPQQQEHAEHVEKPPQGAAQDQAVAKTSMSGGSADVEVIVVDAGGMPNQQALCKPHAPAQAQPEEAPPLPKPRPRVRPYPKAVSKGQGSGEVATQGSGAEATSSVEGQTAQSNDSQHAKPMPKQPQDDWVWPSHSYRPWPKDNNYW